MRDIYEGRAVIGPTYTTEGNMGYGTMKVEVLICDADGTEQASLGRYLLEDLAQVLHNLTIGGRAAALRVQVIVEA